MQDIYSDIASSPVAISLLLVHLLILAQCAIKFIDYQITKKQLEKLN